MSVSNIRLLSLSASGEYVNAKSSSPGSNVSKINRLSNRISINREGNYFFTASYPSSNDNPIITQEQKEEGS